MITWFDQERFRCPFIFSITSNCGSIHWLSLWIKSQQWLLEQWLCEFIENTICINKEISGYFLSQVIWKWSRKLLRWCVTSRNPIFQKSKIFHTFFNCLFYIQKRSKTIFVPLLSEKEAVAVKMKRSALTSFSVQCQMVEGIPFKRDLCVHAGSDNSFHVFITVSFKQ